MHYLVNRFKDIDEIGGSGRTFEWNPCTTFTDRDCKEVLVSLTILTTTTLKLHKIGTGSAIISVCKCKLMF